MKLVSMIMRSEARVQDVRKQSPCQIQNCYSRQGPHDRAHARSTTSAVFILKFHPSHIQSQQTSKTKEFLQSPIPKFAVMVILHICPMSHSTLILPQPNVKHRRSPYQSLSAFRLEQTIILPPGLAGSSAMPHLEHYNKFVSILKLLCMNCKL